MGTLYIVGATASNPEDITFRALRILREVALVVADDVAGAQRLLNRVDSLSHVGAWADADTALVALQESDVALLLDNRSLGAPDLPQRLIRRAVEQGFPVTPIPGPSLPVTALILSGLPTDTFVYLGSLLQEASQRRTLLAAVAGERRTLVALASPDHLPDVLADLLDTLGDRPLTIMSADGEIRRGTVSQTQAWPLQGDCALVVGGAREQPMCWAEDKLQAEIQARLGQNLGVKEISRRLAVKSGWPRREIYRLAVEIAHSDADWGKGT